MGARIVQELMGRDARVGGSDSHGREGGYVAANHGGTSADQHAHHSVPLTPQFSKLRPQWSPHNKIEVLVLGFGTIWWFPYAVVTTGEGSPRAAC